MSVLPNEGNPQNGDGGQGANLDPSNPQGQPLEERLSKVTSDIERIAKMVGALQSDKDKAAYRAEKTANATADQIANIAKYLGVTTEQVQEAQRKSVLDDLVNQRIGNDLSSAPVAAGTAAPVNTLAELTGIDSALGLPSNDPRVTNLKLLYANDPQEYLKQGVSLRDSIKNQSPTPAEQPLPGGNAAPTRTPTQTALENEYRTKQQAIMNGGYPHAVRVEKLTDLKAEMRGKGLSVR